jgi:hypothetical protein
VARPRCGSGLSRLTRDHAGGQPLHPTEVILSRKSSKQGNAVKCSSLISYAAIGFLFVLLGACAMTEQYAIPRDTNNKLLTKPKWKIRLAPYVNSAWGRGEIRNMRGPVRIKQLRAEVDVPERCLFWVLFIPSGWVECTLPKPSPVKDYTITLALYSAGAERFPFDPGEVHILRKGTPVPFHGSLTKPVVISTQPVRMTLTIDDWGRVGSVYEIDLADSLDLPGVIIRMQRFSTTTIAPMFLY